MSTATIHQVHITCSDKPEVMERILRVVRHRGFALDSLQMQKRYQDSSVAYLEVQLQVSSQRPISQLQTQLEKLFDLHSVKSLLVSAEAQLTIA